MNDTILELVHRAMPVFTAYRDGNLDLMKCIRAEDPNVGHVAFGLAYHISERQQSGTSLGSRGSCGKRRFFSAPPLRP